MHFEVGQDYYNQGDIKKALESFENGIFSDNKEDQDKCYKRIKNLAEAGDTSALDLMVKIAKSKEEQKYTYILGMAYEKLEMIDKAYDCFYRTADYPNFFIESSFLKIAQKAEDGDEIALMKLRDIADKGFTAAMGRIALIYKENRLYDQASDYYFKLYQSTKREDDYKSIQELAKWHDFESSTYERSFKNLKSLADDGLVIAKSSIASIYKNRNLHNEASDCYLELYKLDKQDADYKEILGLAEQHDVDSHCFKNLEEITDSDNISRFYTLGVLYDVKGCPDQAIDIYSKLYDKLKFNSKCQRDITKGCYEALVKHAEAGNLVAREVLESISKEGDIPTTKILSEIFKSFNEEERSVLVLEDAFNYEDDDVNDRTEITLKLKQLMDEGNATAQNVLQEIAKKNQIVAFLIR